MKTKYEWHEGIPWPRRVSEPGDWEPDPNHESPEDRIRRLFPEAQASPASLRRKHDR